MTTNYTLTLADYIRIFPPEFRPQTPKEWQILLEDWLAIMEPRARWN